MKKVLFSSTATVIALLVLGCFHSVKAQDVSQSIDELKDTLLPAEYRNRTVTLDDVKRFVREKCKQASGGVYNLTLYEEIEQGFNNLTTCVSNLGNLSQLQEEIEEARPTGELDTVFHRYCTKVPKSHSCLSDFNAKLQPCLSLAEQKQNVVLKRVLSGIVGFMCERGGDQLALFVAERGPECLEANRVALTACLKTTFAGYIPKDGSVPDVLNLPELVVTLQYCKDVESFEQCAVHNLKRCRDITPANIAESIFKYVRRESNCQALLDAERNEVSILRDPSEDSDSGAGTNGVSLLAFTLFGTIHLLFIV